MDGSVLPFNLIDYPNKPDLTTFVVRQWFDDCCLSCLVSMNNLAISDIDSGVVEVSATSVSKDNNIPGHRVRNPSSDVGLFIC